MYMCESQKYDMEFEVRKRGFEVNLKSIVDLLLCKHFKCTSMILSSESLCQLSLPSIQELEVRLKIKLLA